MNILASVVPGIRDVRAPLIAGYMWLLVAWLAVQPDLPLREGEGTFGSVVELAHTAGPLATAVGVSVAAYLIGAVSRAAATLADDLLRNPRVRARVEPVLLSRVRTRLEWPDSQTGAFGPSVPSGLRDAEVAWARERPDPRPEDALQVIEAYRDARSVLAGEIRLGGGSLERSALAVVAQPLNDLTKYLTAAELEDLANQIRVAETRMSNELSLSATLLVGDQPQAFGETDRLRGEGELRVAVVPPLLALTGVLAVTDGLAWLVLLPAILVLLWQGTLREDHARRLVASAIAYGKIPSPGRDEFKEYVRGIRERIAREDSPKDIDDLLRHQYEEALAFHERRQDTKN